MLFDTNKDKGRAGISLAIAYFGSNGYTISIPLNDTQDYDLIVDKDDKLYKVQVKSTNQVTPSGAYSVSLRNTGGTKGTTYSRVCESTVDYVFVLCGNKTMYLLPFDVIKDNTNSISVSSNNQYNKYIVEL